MTSSTHFLPPFEPNNEDHIHQYFPFLSSPPSQASFSSSTSSLISPTAFHPYRDQEINYKRELLKQYQESQEVDDEYVSHGGSSDQQSLSPPSLSSLESGNDYGLKLSIFEGDQLKDNSIPSENKGPVSWMSSKMRLMKKMINSDRADADKPIRSKLWFQADQTQLSSPSTTNITGDNLATSNNTMIRTCSDCNTTRTPLWRSGPKGPKTLCNACGIRQRKARRAIAVAAAVASDGVPAINTSSMQKKVHCSKKKSGKGHVGQHKKQCKLTPIRTKNDGFEDFILNLSNNLALHRVIPQDETEAAILLMALSCGLVNG
ncbi:Gata transcription factor [Thalictrum thalictroides]|uniref:Gata transcription factor n=1 Tax=Thalictrum thalictroides TaxID=46969 RepID=A0A7J6XHJ3_THATH|nr:Gata transcription factor [Thalictrum thalictroides]